MSSAFLYLAIIAIWAGVLIPRWLKRDSSRAKAAKSSQPASPDARESPDELTDDEPVEVNVGGDRSCSPQNDAAGRGYEAPASNDNFVSGPDIKRIKSQIECDTAVGNGHCVLGMGESGEFFLKLVALLAGPIVYFSRSQHFRRSFNFLPFKNRPGGKWSRANRCTTV